MRRRSLSGVVLSVAAAAAFGVFAPAAKGALTYVSPLRAAGLTYVAAGLVASAAVVVRLIVPVAPTGRQISLRDAPRLLGMTILGGVLGPALFFSGVERVAAHHAAVIQHLEFALTVLAALVLLGERPGRRGCAGLALVALSLLLFAVSGTGPTDSTEPSSWIGLALLVGACVAWALDNSLARSASELDPLRLVSIKGFGAGAVLLLLTRDDWRMSVRAWGLILLAGGVGVGASLMLELLALRKIGAALNAGLFATGPAFGFVWSVVFLDEVTSPAAWFALAACALGAVALSVDRHEHLHVHQSIRHTHRHHHLDAHHFHTHGPGLDPTKEHVHEHEHGQVEHSHPHAHDDHHRHRHGRGKGAAMQGTPCGRRFEGART